MNYLVFQNGTSLIFKTDLLASKLETAAILLARPVPVSPKHYRLLVTEIIFTPTEAYDRRTGDSIILKPEYLATIIKRARNERYSIILVHTHPGSEYATASAIDRKGEEMLFPTLFNRVPGVPHGRLIFGLYGYDSMLRLSAEGDELPLEVIDVGPLVQRLAKVPEDHFPESIFDRQIRAFGAAGQQRLESFRVAIVGLGGLGSVVAQQLVHLGCRSFLLIDNDFLEETNLNRVVGARPTDIGRAKVDIARDLIYAVRPSATIEVLHDTVLRNKVAKNLLEADIFFCCTDSHGSRAVVAQLAYQYLLPGFDLGVQIEAKDGKISHITGRVQMLAPGLACLVCSDLLNPRMIRIDLMTETQRRLDPYIVGAQERQPAVISLNSTVASLAVTMYLGAVAGIPVKARHQIYRAEVGVVRSISSEQNPQCVICSSKGALGRGDEWLLPGRLE